jgi:hypothetical protein
MIWLRQSTAVTIEVGPFVDSTDSFTPETALTIPQADVRLSKNGGAFAQKSDTGSATHMENGYYAVPLNATDTNTLGRLRLHITEPGALPVWETVMVVPAAIYDALISGTEWLSVDPMKVEFSISGNTLTVRKPDDTTIAYTKTVTATAGANPVTGVS